MYVPDVEEGELGQLSEGTGERDEGEVHVQRAVQSVGERVGGVVEHLQETFVWGGGGERG